MTAYPVTYRDAQARVVKALAEHGLKMRPEMLDVVVEAVVGDMVEQHVVNSLLDDLRDEHAEELKEAFQAGQDAMVEKAGRIHDLVLILNDAHALVSKSAAWSGPPEWRDEALARIDALREYLKK